MIAEIRNTQKNTQYAEKNAIRRKTGKYTLKYRLMGAHRIIFAQLKSALKSRKFKKKSKNTFSQQLLKLTYSYVYSFSIFALLRPLPRP